MSEETLLSQSRIWLFGRILGDIVLSQAAYADIPPDEAAGNLADTPPDRSQNKFLRNQLSAPGAGFARIFAFSYEAAFYELGRPAIFLVHGGGIDAEGTAFSLTKDQRLYSRMPSDTGRTGLSSVIGSFTGGMKAWAYDRADFTVRMDMDGGSFDTLLLSAELSDWQATRSAGSVARSAGSVARAAGSVARAAGSVARSRRSSGDE